MSFKNTVKHELETQDWPTSFSLSTPRKENSPQQIWNGNYVWKTSCYNVMYLSIESRHFNERIHTISISLNWADWKQRGHNAVKGYLMTFITTSDASNYYNHWGITLFNENIKHPLMMKMQKTIRRKRK